MIILLGEETFDFGDQRRGFAGLDHNRIEPALARLIELLDVRVTGRGDERDMVGSVGVAQPPRGLEPCDTGQFKVQDDDVGYQSGGLLDRPQTVLGCLDRVALRAQIHPPDFQGIRVVVYEQDSFRRHNR